MKKFIIILGILVLELMLTGTIFKFMHWPGANLLFVMGSVLCSVVFLPLAIYESYREQKRYLSVHVIGMVVFSLGILSILFKVMHWSGAQILFDIAFPLPFVLFLPVFLYQTRLDKKVQDRNFIGVLFGLTFIAVFGVLLSL